MTSQILPVTFVGWCEFGMATYLALLAAALIACGVDKHTCNGETASDVATPPTSATANADADAIVAAVQPPLDRYADAIREFEREDNEHIPPAGGTVFIGSSTFALVAPMLREYFADYQPIVRAFGGSTIPEINHYIRETVLKYKPARICFYAGTNDIAELGHDGTQVYRDFKNFQALVHAALPRTEILFISMSMAPARVQWHEQYVTGNKLVADLAAKTGYIRYVDVTPVMYDEHGNLHSDWFLEDMTHMNQHGYDAWLPIIRHALQASRV
jgi:lysophospholipase L1-like esterase